jgi:hypothetical protein
MNPIENDYIMVWKEDDIIMVIFKSDIVLDTDGAMESVKLRKTLTTDKDYPMLVDIRNIKNATKEARKYMGSDEAGEGVSKAAIIIDSNFSAVIGNLFLTLNKPKTPTKLFGEKSVAIKWLKEPLNGISQKKIHFIHNLILV